MKILPKGLQDYTETWQAMRAFTDNRTSETEDEIWILEHPPVYTQGQAGKPEHLLTSNHIPLVQSDRGGQITYHGPGQLIAYVLLDLKRAGLGPRQLVCQIEKAVIALLNEYDITAFARKEAPGVYVELKGETAKIASLGLRIRKGYSYHGLALNVDIDLSPFSNINPCGFSGLRMTQIKDFVPTIALPEVQNKLCYHLTRSLESEKPCLV